MLNAALAVLQDEHRSLATVVHGLRYLMRELRKGKLQPDFALLGAMIHYIENFPEKLHHPKEEAYLFKRLRERTQITDPTLMQLERQHAEGAQRVETLKRALDAYASGKPGGFHEFSAEVEEFAEETWEHLNTEEKILIPLAMKYLTAEDWIEIAAAFGENGDPRFGTEADYEFRKLFSGIMEIAPRPVGNAGEGGGAA